MSPETKATHTPGAMRAAKAIWNLSGWKDEKQFAEIIDQETAASEMLEALDAFIGLEFYEAGTPRILAYNHAIEKARAAQQKAKGE